MAVFAAMEGRESICDELPGLRGGIRRLGSNVKAVVLLPVDRDQGDKSPEEVLADVRAYGREALLHTSFSHTDEKPKLRILFPLLTPFLTPDKAARDRYKLSYLALIRALGWEGEIDESCKDAGRAIYLPSRQHKSPYWWSRVEGPLLDLYSLKVETPSPRVRTSTTRKVSSSLHFSAAPSPSLSGIELATMLAEIGDVRRNNLSEGKIDTKCPFDDHHSEPGKEDDCGFYVQNASANDSGYAYAFCHHHHCLHRTPEAFVEKLRAQGRLITDPKARQVLRALAKRKAQRASLTPEEIAFRRVRNGD